MRSVCVRAASDIPKTKKTKKAYPASSLLTSFHALFCLSLLLMTTTITTSKPFDFINKPPSIGAVIRGRAPATCLSFHEGGDHLFVASAEDARLRLVDCIKGTSDRAATRYETNGIRIVEATHDKYSVLIAGEGQTRGSSNITETISLSPQHSVTYVSVYDNAVLRTFSGHSAKVTNLSMSPVDDRFLSSSDDRTIRLWNIQQPACIAMIPTIPNGNGGSAPYACFDSTGLVFAVTTTLPGTTGNALHLYDARKYENGPFSELKVESLEIENFLIGKGSVRLEVARELSRLEWNCLKFNSSGSQLLAISSRGGYAALLDGFTAQILQTFVLPTADDEQQQDTITACFTQDDSYILTGGCSNGSIQCWEVSTGNLVQTLTGHVDGPVRAIACNPKRAMFASSSTNTALWI